MLNWCHNKYLRSKYKVQLIYYHLKPENCINSSVYNDDLTNFASDIVFDNYFNESPIMSYEDAILSYSNMENNAPAEGDETI